MIGIAELGCLILPPNVRPQCDAAMQMYGPQIIDLLVKGAPPNQVCSLLQLCRAPSGLLVEPAMVSNNLNAACHVILTSVRTGLHVCFPPLCAFQDMAPPPMVPGGHPMSPPAPVAPLCGICEFAMKMVEGLVENKPIQVTNIPAPPF